jgi:hypothetical protein
VAQRRRHRAVAGTSPAEIRRRRGPRSRACTSASAAIRMRAPDGSRAT